ncbi:MAG: T9SS C-terminal target domain-containing protein [Bacteroidetes bacterium]|nr:MAG: T9SS C-terminal target domain-containing protein [Bacteroidota bacterium]
MAQPLLETRLTSSFDLNWTDAHVLPTGETMLIGFAHPLGAQDSTLALVAKVDTGLNLLWVKRFKGLSRDDLSALTPLSDGNLLIGGTARANFSLEQGGSLIKIDTAGQILWEKVYDDSSDDRVLATFEASSQSLLTVIRKGVTNSPTKVILTNQQGNLTSSRAYVHASDNQGLVIDAAASDGAGTYYLIGDRPGPAGHRELVILAMDTVNMLWSRTYDLGRTAACGGAICDGTGALYLSGIIDDTTTFFSTSNSWLMKLDDQGGVVWATEVGQTEPYTNLLGDPVLAPDGSLRWPGTAFTSEGPIGWLLAAGTDGSVLWHRAYAQEASQALSTLDLLPTGLLLTGSIGPDGWLLRLGEMGESACSDTTIALEIAPLSVTRDTIAYINQPPSLAEVNLISERPAPALTATAICAASVAHDRLRPLAAFRLGPNPASDHLILSWQGEGAAWLDATLFSPEGRSLRTGRLVPGQEALWAVGNLPAGLYVLRLQMGAQVDFRKVRIR